MDRGRPGGHSRHLGCISEALHVTQPARESAAPGRSAGRDARSLPSTPLTAHTLLCSPPRASRAQGSQGALPHVLTSLTWPSVRNRLPPPLAPSPATPGSSPSPRPVLSPTWAHPGARRPRCPRSPGPAPAPPGKARCRGRTDKGGVQSSPALPQRREGAAAGPSPMSTEPEWDFLPESRWPGQRGRG